MKRLARWLGGAVLAIALLYAFGVLAGALWLRRHLTPDDLAASTGCWGRADSLQKAARTQWSRDRLVLYVFRFSRGAPHRQGPGVDLRMAFLDHIYLTWWPIAERERLFAETAPRLRPCRMLPAD